MRYILYSTATDRESNKVHVDSEELNGFEDMMERFTLIASARDFVLVIEAETRKVVCCYNTEGKVQFNKGLLDGTIYMNDEEGEIYG